MSVYQSHGYANISQVPAGNRHSLDIIDNIYAGEDDGALVQLKSQGPWPVFLIAMMMVVVVVEGRGSLSVLTLS